MAFLCKQLAPVIRRTVAPRILASFTAARPHPTRAVHTSSAINTTMVAPEPAPAAQERTYTNFYVYKTRAAMCVNLVPPTFVTPKDGIKVMDRDGVMLLEFANVNPSAPATEGPPQSRGGSARTYSWDKKAFFALSVQEMGSLLVGDFGGDKGLNFYHDPTKISGREASGEKGKRLTVKQLPDGNLNFNMNNGADNFSVPVTRAEFEVIKSIAQFAIPRLLGFDRLFS